MSYTDDRCFVDTNILVYAHDRSSPARRAVARQILQELWEKQTGALSTQVLQELYVTLTGRIKPPVTAETAIRIVRALGEWRLVATDVELIVHAADLSRTHRWSHWDALVLAAALRVEARTLLSEDFQDGFRLGALTVRNPFASGRRRR